MTRPSPTDLKTAPARQAANQPEARPPGAVVAVVAARGGLGASCLSLLLARALTVAGQKVALVDADPAGGLGLLMGTGPGPGLRWADLPPQETAFRVSRLVAALPSWLGMRVMTGVSRGGARSEEILAPVITALASVHDVVVVDLPRTLPVPPQATVLLLTALDLRSAAAARVLARRIAGESQRPVRLVVLQEGEDIDVDGLVRTTGCQVIGPMAVDRSVAQRTARGDDVTRGRGRARRDARALAHALLEELQGVVAAP